MTIKRNFIIRLLIPLTLLASVGGLGAYLLLNHTLYELLLQYGDQNVTREAAEAVTRYSINIIVGAFLLFTTLIGIATIWFVNRYYKPLKMLVKQIEFFKTHCRLEPPTAVSKLDEFQQLHKSFLDISDQLQLQHARQRVMQQSIDNHAMYDQLTNLPNRAHLNSIIENLIERSQSTGKRFALIYLDLDNFKLINDSMGHGIGDELLKACAKRIFPTLDTKDVLTRFGGDEFVIAITSRQRESDYITIAKNVIALLHEKFIIQRHEFVISTSIGISIYPEHGEDAGSLLKHADIAMYEAKEEGRNGYRIFNNEMIERIHNQLYLEKEMRDALAKGEFTLFYQPQVDTLTAEVIGAEALIRWIHPDQGLISPVRFIELAEHTGFIVELGAWVIEESCKLISRHREMLMPLKLSVNISAKQFTHEGFVNSVKQALELHKTPTENLVFEITETLLMANKTRSLEILHELKGMGISIAMDDFGTGYSSLAYLKDFPIDIIKIDKSFIQGAFDNPEDYNIIKAIISLGHELGLKVVAEGVEELHQYEFIKTSHCSIIQGYLFSKPLTEDNYLKYIYKQNYEN